MPIIIQVCVVIATISIVAVAFVAVRLMKRLEVISESVAGSLTSVERILDQHQQASERIQGLLGSLEEITNSVKSGASQLEAVVGRAAGLTGAVLDEVEGPVHKAMAMLRGVQAGASFFVERWARRSSAHVHVHAGGDHV